MSSVETAATEFNDSVGRSVGRSTSYRTVEFLRRGSVPTESVTLFDSGSHRKKVHHKQHEDECNRHPVSLPVR